MLSALEKAKQNGAKIISVNPLEEAGLVRFKNPQTPKGVAVGTALADLHLPIRLNGDLALFQAIGSLLLEWDAIDRDFIDEYVTGFEAYAAHVADLDWAKVEAATGLTREQVTEAARMFARLAGDDHLLGDGHHPAPQLGGHDQGDRQRRAAAGQHRQAGRRAVPGPRPLQRPGRPHHGHLGARARTTSSTRSATSSASTRRASTASTPSDAIRALRDGKARVFFAMGGNFVAAAPDTEATEAAMRNAALTVHVSTKLNRSHVVHGGEALILPALGRSEKDLTGGRAQRVTVEDSMSAVHASRGPLDPPSEHLRSEVDIVCSLALATLGEDSPVPWAAFRVRLHRDPPPDRPRRARLRVVRREGRPARRLRAAAPAPRQPRLRDREPAGRS